MKFLSVILLSSSFVGGLAAARKSQICHRTSSEDCLVRFKTIEVASKAVTAHQAHGDGVAGPCSAICEGLCYTAASVQPGLCTDIPFILSGEECWCGLTPVARCGAENTKCVSNTCQCEECFYGSPLAVDGDGCSACAYPDPPTLSIQYDRSDLIDEGPLYRNYFKILNNPSDFPACWLTRSEIKIYDQDNALLAAFSGISPLPTELSVDFDGDLEKNIRIELMDPLCNRVMVSNGITIPVNDQCSDPELNDCDANADCTDTQEGFTCECKDGYIGNGVSCEPALCTDPYTCGSVANLCGTNPDSGIHCFCTQDVKGSPVCVTNEPCVSYVDCTPDTDCGEGYFCVPDTCCGVPKCLQDCPNKEGSSRRMKVSGSSVSNVHKLRGLCEEEMTPLGPQCIP